MRRVIILLSLVFVFASSNAQITFQKTYGSSSIETTQCLTWQGDGCIQQTGDDGYIICGGTRDSITGPGLLLIIKTDKNGDTLFTKIYRKPGTVQIRDIYGDYIHTFGEGYLVSGEGRSSSYAPYENNYLIKLNAQGDTVWTRYFSLNNMLHSYSNSGCVTHDGNFMMSVRSYNRTGLIKIDPNGNIIWNKIFTIPSPSWSSNYFEFYHISNSIDNGFILCGSSNDYFCDGVIAKTDPLGNIIWIRGLGGDWADHFNSAVELPDKSIVAVGYTRSFDTVQQYERFFMVKVDSSGNFKWAKILVDDFGGRATSVIPTNDNNLAICFQGYWGNALMKCDTAGNIIWTKVYGGNANEFPNSVIQTSDGGYAISGYTESFGAGEDDLYLVKTDANGNVPCFINNVVVADSNVFPTISFLQYTTTSGAQAYTFPVIKSQGLIVTPLCYQNTSDIAEIPKVIDSVVIFPNPTTGLINITLAESAKDRRIDVINSFGQVILSKEINNSTSTTLDLSNFAKGLYFVKVQNGNGVAVRKVIIE